MPPKVILTHMMKKLIQDNCNYTTHIKYFSVFRVALESLYLIPSILATKAKQGSIQSMKQDQRLFDLKTLRRYDCEQATILHLVV